MKQSKTVKKLAKRTVATRATQPVLVPQAMPADLLYVAEGDHITQLRVAGATQADPFHIFVTGAATTHGFAIIDEIDSILIDEARTPLIISGPTATSTHQFDSIQPLVEGLYSKQNQLCSRHIILCMIIYLIQLNL